MSKNKGQSLVIQFILFFLLGFVLFLVVGNFFKLQSDIFRIDLSNQALKLTGSYVSGLSISLIDSCKHCNYASIKFQLENETTNYIFVISLNESGLKTSIPFVVGKSYESKMHNIIYSEEPSGSAASARPITLTYNRTKNELKVV